MPIMDADLNFDEFKKWMKEMAEEHEKKHGPPPDWYIDPSKLTIEFDDGTVLKGTKH